MKDVIDAVIEFKGKWIYDEPSIVEQISTGGLSSWRELCDHGLNKDNFRIICNEDQFNACIDELSTNYGTSCAYAEYKKQWESKVDIDWSKAPEWSTGYSQHSEWFYWVGDKGYSCETAPQCFYEFGAFDGSTEYYIKGDFTTIEERPSEYTPEVGEKCYITYPGGNHDCEILGYHEDYVWFTGMHLYSTVRIDDCTFKPLTPPIELIDGKAYQYNYKGEHIGLYYKDEDEFFCVGLNHAREICTNIKLLTPEK